METGLFAPATQAVLWGAFFGLLFTDSVAGAAVGGVVVALFITIGVIGKPSSRYGLYE